MAYIVAKYLTTTRRRLKINDPVTETDDLSPHTFADLKTRGFIVEKSEMAAVSTKQPTNQPFRRLPSAGDVA